MTDTAEGRGAASDADSVRTLVLGLLDRIEHFAAGVIDAEGSTDVPTADLGPAIRATVDTVLGEVGELLSKLIAAVIAVLEAISAALDEAVGTRGRATPTRPARPGRGFQPIAVEIETDDGPL